MRHYFLKAVFGIAALLLSFGAYAQDIIVTTDAQKIEAKIIEVSKSEIRYKEKDYPDGPTFVISTDEISSIIYANGKVVLYNQPNTPAPKSDELQPAIDESIAEITLLSGRTITAHIVELRSDHVTYTIDGSERVTPASQLAKVTFLHNGQVKIYNQDAATVVSKPKAAVTQTELPVPTATPTSGRIYRDGKEYMHNNRFISSKEVARILERENQAAYKQWKKANGLLAGGAICAGIGGGLVLGGLISLVSGDPIPCLAMECCALVPLGIGIGLCLGANNKYIKSIDIYNSKYDKMAMQLQWRVAPTEVGLAIAF